VSARYSTNISVDLAGLGATTPIEDPVPENEGDPVNQEYSDGFWRVDLSENAELDFAGTSIPDNDDGDKVYPATTFVRWLNNERQFDASTGTVTLNRYNSEGRDGAVESDAGSAYGWEVALRRDFGTLGSENVRFGLVAGFAFGRADTTLTRTFEVAVANRQDTFRVPTQFFSDPDQFGFDTDPGTDFTGGPDDEGYTGQPSTGIPVPFPSFGSTERTVSGDLEGTYELDGAYFTLRLGPDIVYDVTSRLAVHVSAGLSATYFSSEFSATKELIQLYEVDGSGNRAAPFSEAYMGALRDFGGTGFSDDDLGSDEEWVIGGFVEGLASFEVMDGVRVFAAAELQVSDVYEQLLPDGETLEVDFGSALHIKSGFAFRF
jgi:hypothetical protein